MRQEDRKAFFTMILAVAELYDKTPSANALELWWQVLQHLELDQVRLGLSRAIQDPDRPRFMPQPADVIKYAGSTKAPVIAWAQVERAMYQHDAYQTVQFEDGVINAVIRDMGGWPWICRQDLSQPWTQKEFERRYEAYRSHAIELHEPLIGIHEANNREGGYLDDIPDTRFICDNGNVKLLPARGVNEIPESQKLLKMLAAKLSMQGDRKELSRDKDRYLAIKSSG